MTEQDVFWAVHSGLSREAPGSAATTELLLRLAEPLPPGPRIADMGCGPGASSVLLAESTGGHVVAIDLHEPFLAETRARAERAGVADRVETRGVSMDTPGIDEGTVDLVWAEGSAYLLGVDVALATWRPLLAEGGRVVLTEVEWTCSEPSSPAREFWAAYPGMRSTSRNVEAFTDAGWNVLAVYRLPESDWDAYYEPMLQRVHDLRASGVDEELLRGVTAEIDLRRTHGDDYAYTGYVLAPR